MIPSALSGPCRITIMWAQPVLASGERAPVMLPQFQLVKAPVKRAFRAEQDRLLTRLMNRQWPLKTKEDFSVVSEPFCRKNLRPVG